MVVQALEKTNMLKDSIIIFSTDNGGPAEGFNLNAASNYPLRGVKNTLWEGGVRGAALLFSPMLKKRNRVANQTMHIADWVPTLYHAAGGNVTYGIMQFHHICDEYLQNFYFHFYSDLGDRLDGKSIWDALSDNGKSDRNEILHNIDDIYGSASLTVDNWKLHKGTNYNGNWDNWYAIEIHKN